MRVLAGKARLQNTCLLFSVSPCSLSAEQRVRRSAVSERLPYMLVFDFPTLKLCIKLSALSKPVLTDTLVSKVI